MTLVIATIIITAICLLALKNNNEFEDIIVAQTQQNLQTVAEAQAVYLHEILSEIKKDLEIIASNIILIQEIELDNVNSEPIVNEYDPLQETFMHSKNIVGSFYHLNAQGIVQHRIPFKEHARGEDFSQKPGVKHIIDTYAHNPKPKQKSYTHMSKIFKANSGRDVISICTAVFNKNKFIGILRSLVYLDTINDMIKSISMGRNSYAWIIDSNGHIIMHPDKDMIGESITKTQIQNHDGDENLEQQVIEDMLNGGQGTSCLVFDIFSDDKIVIAWSPIQISSDRWSIAVQVDFVTISAPIADHARKMYMITAIIIMIFFGLGTWFYIANREKERLVFEVSSAEKANKLKSEFLANMSHEIRTPLNSMIGFTESITQTNSLDVARSQAGIVLRESEHLLVLINDILDHAKIEAGKMDIEHRPLDLSQLLESVISTANSLVKGKNLQLHISIGDDVSQFIRNDSLRLRQIIMNLVGNAIKFTEKGSVTIQVESFKTDKEHSVLRFSVIDTGIGIPKDRQDAIFSSFSQVDGTTTRKFGGTGLGMSISKKLIDLLGGQMGLESELGKGSTFWFTIPVNLNDAPLEDEQLALIVDCRAFIPRECHAVLPMQYKGGPGSFYHQA